MNRIPAHVEDAIRELVRSTSPVCAYVYDRAALRVRVSTLRAALPAGTALHYAVKANGHPALLSALASHVDGFEVSSGGELRLALAAGPGPSPIMFAGPAKTDADLAAAIQHGATVNVESTHELRRLSLLAVRARATAEVGLRVNLPDGVPRDAALRITGEPTQFGIDSAQLDEAIRLALRLPGIQLRGLHLHAMSNNLDAASHAAYIASCLAWAEQTARRTGFAPDHVNVGGGFGVDYDSGRIFDLSALSGIKVPDRTRLVVEPGRWIAAPAGWYAAQVLDIKQSHGRWFSVVRGGTHHFRLPASWGYSHPFSVLPVDEWPYPLPRPCIRDTTADVVGELCTPRDVLARDAPVERLRVGDVLVFSNTGAYGWEVAHRDFLAHPHPERVVL